MPTNCADDGCTAVIGLGLKFGVQAGKPFNLSASRGQVIKGVGHVVGSCAIALKRAVGASFQTCQRKRQTL